MRKQEGKEEGNLLESEPLRGQPEGIHMQLAQSSGQSAFGWQKEQGCFNT